MDQHYLLSRVALYSCVYTVLLSHFLSGKISSDSQGRGPNYQDKGDTTAYKRTPQNALGPGPLPWVCVQKRVVYYEFHTIHRNEHLSKTISEIEQNTCLKFENVGLRASSHRESNGKACQLSPSCMGQSNEETCPRCFAALLRCMGKLLEHRRWDRDRYVRIYWENITPTHGQYFIRTKGATTQGLSYDFLSLMHFKHNAYSKTLMSTIVPLNGSISRAVMGRAQKPSKQDYLDINLSYCGTEIVMQYTLTSSVGKDYIALSWKKPKHTPLEIRVKSECSLPCESKPYLTKHSNVPVNQTQFELANLRPGMICRVHILAVYNPSGLDRGNNYEYETFQSEPTGSPTSVQVSLIKGIVGIVSWKPIPCFHQNGAILRYLIESEFNLAEGPVARHDQTSGDVRKITLRSLRPNTKYRVKVAGVNSAGAGTFSLPVELVTPGVCPGRIQRLVYESTCDSITINWIPPHDENDMPYPVRLKYHYKQKGKTTTFREMVKCTTWTISELESNVAVQLSLKAVNEQGKKGPSSYFTAHTKRSDECSLQDEAVRSKSVNVLVYSANRILS